MNMLLMSTQSKKMQEIIFTCVFVCVFDFQFDITYLYSTWSSTTLVGPIY